MKHSLTLAGAAMAICIFAGPGLAEDLTADGDQNGNRITIEPADKTAETDMQTEPGVQSGDTDAGTASDVDIGKTQAKGAAPSADDVLSAMKGSAAAVSAIKSMTTVSKIHMVKVGDLPAPDSAQSLDSAIDANRSQIDNLQEAIRTNTSLKAMLDKKDVDVSTIIATRTGDDGSLTVYTK